MVQEMLRVLHLHLKTGFQTARMKVLKLTPTMAYLLQQGHTYSNKATPPNCKDPKAKCIQTTTDHLANPFKSPRNRLNHTHLWQGEICTFIFNTIRHINILQSENLHISSLLPLVTHSSQIHSFTIKFPSHT